MGHNSSPEDDETPEQKINAWLNLDKNATGHYKSGDWMALLTPHLSLHSLSTTPPHPSVTYAFTVDASHCNRMNNLHGGCAATLFDYCTTLPLALVSRPGFWRTMGTSRSLNVTYLRPVPEGESVLIECEIVQVGKKLCTLRGVMRRKGDGALLAVCEHGKVNIDPDPKL